MASPAQIAANQANAQKSSGPRTEQGKDTSRGNATRHGLCKHITCLDDEDTNEVQALLADLNEEHQPAGPTEEILVHKMAENFWLSKRASYYLAVHTMYNEGRGADKEDEIKQISLYLRYYTTNDRAFSKNLNDLRKLQKERKQQSQQPAADPEIGFVPQNAKPAARTAAPAAPIDPIDPIPGAPRPVITPITGMNPVPAVLSSHSGPSKLAA